MLSSEPCGLTTKKVAILNLNLVDTSQQIRQSLERFVSPKDHVTIIDRIADHGALLGGERVIRKCLFEYLSPVDEWILEFQNWVKNATCACEPLLEKKRHLLNKSHLAPEVIWSFIKTDIYRNLLDVDKFGHALLLNSALNQVKPDEIIWIDGDSSYMHKNDVCLLLQAQKIKFRVVKTSLLQRIKRHITMRIYKF